MNYIMPLIDFIVGTIILKGIVAHWSAEMIMKYAKRTFEKTPRKQVIWEHYQHRAKGEGHTSSKILDCTELKCATL